jgi:hypothetical protein
LRLAAALVTGETVEIIRIVDGRRDLQTLF